MKKFEKRITLCVGGGSSGQAEAAVRCCTSQEELDRLCDQVHAAAKKLAAAAALSADRCEAYLLLDGRAALGSVALPVAACPDLLSLFKQWRLENAACDEAKSPVSVK